MGNADQSPLGFNLLEASQVESPETQVRFHIPEGAFGLDTELLSQGNALLGEQVLSGLSAIFSGFETDLNVAVTLGFGIKVSITRDIYAHTFPEMQSEAAEMIDDLITPVEQESPKNKVGEDLAVYV
jgi:hypothetical protein